MGKRDKLKKALHDYYDHCRAIAEGDLLGGENPTEKVISQILQITKVKLPPRKKTTDREILIFNNAKGAKRTTIDKEWTFRSGWNACIDKVKEMNSYHTDE